MLARRHKSTRSQTCDHESGMRLDPSTEKLLAEFFEPHSAAIPDAVRCIPDK
jgi:hypothetical protein